MKKISYNKIIILLIILSFLLLFLAFVYYDMTGKVKDYKYIDTDEYKDVKEGLEYLSGLPIHFNIINKYFSDFNNLSQNEKEEIVMAYAIKNKYKLYEWGNKHYCINKKDLDSEELLDKFNLKTKISGEMIETYIDDYGSYTSTFSAKTNNYHIVLDDNQKNKYHLYSKFSHYKQEGSKYIFYLYQGYYDSNCKEGDKLVLFDFISGKEIYEDVCNKNKTFNRLPTDRDLKKLQLYKYELKKKNNNFYLSGYNPVRGE